MKRYGLLGKNIGYSFSKGFFGEKFKKEQLACSYENFDLDTIADFPSILKLKNLSGINVTIPYKEDVIAFLDELHDTAKEIGAVNVIKFDKKNNKLIGYNSDYYGFKNSLTPVLKSNTKNALILGTGGASKAIAYALKTLNITYTFVSRNPDPKDPRPMMAYTDLNEKWIKNTQLIINCTPLGTHPDTELCPPIPYQYVTNNHILYDLIYNPPVSLFLQKGLAQHATTCNGQQMLILQAEKSWEIWEN